MRRPARAVAVRLAATGCLRRLVRSSEHDYRCRFDRPLESARDRSARSTARTRCSCWRIWHGSFRWLRLIAGGNDADGLGLAGGGAAVSGARWLRTMRTIVLPQLRVGIAAAWVVAFVLAFGELGASAFSWRRQVSRHCPFASTRSSPILRPPTWPFSRCLQSLVIFMPLALLGAAASLREAT